MFVLRLVVTAIALLMSTVCGARVATSVVDLNIRGITQRFEYVRPELTIANVVVLPAGDGVLRLQNNGSMSGMTAVCDPIIRNQPAFSRRGYALAFVDAPSDQRSGLSESFRTSGEHVRDVIEIIRYMQNQADVPVWVIGGGAAAQSALAVAINYPANQLLGTVILSNEESETYSTEAEVNLITGPTLIVNHTGPRAIVGQTLAARLMSAPVRQLYLVSGGVDGACGYQLFEGIDPDIVGIIAGFIDRNSALMGGGEPLVRVALEYYNENLDHYFVTYLPDEIAAVDRSFDWARTGGSFNVFRTAWEETSPVCRFYVPPPFGDSHFYGRGVDECTTTGKRYPSFVLEGPEFFHEILPVQGECPPGTRAVYRTFDNRPDVNHRYMVERTLREQMQRQGWIAEGDGLDLIVMCAPL